MARRGTFDVGAIPKGWFDIVARADGFFDVVYLDLDAGDPSDPVAEADAMVTRPRFNPIDRLDLGELPDLYPARVSTIPREQHDLMSGWGGPAQARSVYWTATTSATNTYTVSYRVPPGVTDIDVAVLVFGTGTIALTTSVDATGTKFRSVDEIGDAIAGAVWLRTNGVLDSSAGAESGRALGVASSPTWTWTDTDITATIVGGSAAGDDVFCFGVAFAPIHVTR